MNRTIKSQLRIVLAVVFGVGILVVVVGLFVRQPSFRATAYSLSERADPARLEVHVRFLCETVVPRNTRNPGNLDRVATYIAESLTDTAFIRNPNYHTSHDLPGTLDYQRMAGVVAGVANALVSFGLRYQVE